MMDLCSNRNLREEAIGADGIQLVVEEMAKKIRKAETPHGGELVRLFIIMSLVNMPGILAILAASWDVIAWLHAILIFAVSMALGWSFMLRTMSRMGLLWCLRRGID